MKTILNILILLALNLYGIQYSTQDIFALDDSVCVDIGDPISYDVLANDQLGSGNYDFTDLTYLFFPNQTCVYLNQGIIEYNPVESCDCGEYELVYQLLDLGSGTISQARVYLTIKCPEYDCSQNDPNCFADQINISTGYDQLNGTTLPPSSAGIYGASQDAEWILVGAPTNNGPVTLNAPAFVIPTNPSWDDIPGVPSRYLSAFQSNSSNQSNISTTADPYIYERKFCVCEESDITINKEVFADNTLQLSLEGNGITPIILENLTAGAGTANFLNPTINSGPVTTTLAPGEYKLVAVHRNDNVNSPMGFNINGTITSSNGSLLTAECCNNGSFITGYKFIDLDCNGIYDGDDYPGENWTIELRDANGNLLQTTTTDSNGYYYFSVNDAGTYLLNEVLPSSATQSFPSGNLHTVNVGAGEVVSSINFGNCICDGITVTADPFIHDDGTLNDCCATLSYADNFVNLKGLRIHTNDADLDFDLTTLDPSLNVNSISSNEIYLTSSTFNNPVPSNLNNFIEMCVSNVINAPQTITIDWYDFNDEIVCSDELSFNCPAEPDCLYLESDSIYCDGGLTFYQMTVCNPYDNDFAVGYIDLNVQQPSGITVNPNPINISTPIQPGTCRTFNMQLSGSGIAGQVFCYQLLAHDFDPNLVDTALCCAFEEEICVDIPPCDPCNEEFIGIHSVTNSDSAGCCYKVDIYNNFDPAFFDEIAVCVISPGTTISNVTNPAGSPWTTNGLTGTTVSFYPNSGFVPLGISSLPEMCFNTSIQPSQQVEIKWLNQNEVVCRDTINVNCVPDCGYIVDESILCSNLVPGLWDFSGSIFNVSGYTVTEVVISSTNPAVIGTSFPVSIPNQTSFGPLNFNIGSPAVAGDTVCFTVSLHATTPDGIYLECCNFQHCVVLPPCENFPQECECDEDFFNHINAGISYSQAGSNPLTYGFTLTDYLFLDPTCDLVKWNFGDGSPDVYESPQQSVIHTFNTSDNLVCATIFRTTPTGECKGIVCVDFSPGVADQLTDITVYPNPAKDIVKVALTDYVPAEFDLIIKDITGATVYSEKVVNKEKSLKMAVDVSNLAPGLYAIVIKSVDKLYSEKIIIE